MVLNYGDVGLRQERIQHLPSANANCRDGYLAQHFTKLT